MSFRRARLSAVALGFAIGVLNGGWMLGIGLSAVHGMFGETLITQWAQLFPGIEVSIKGSIISGAWGFLTGLASGLVLAWIYNLCLCCCSRQHCGCCKSLCESCSNTVVEKK